MKRERTMEEGRVTRVWIVVEDYGPVFSVWSSEEAAEAEVARLVGKGPCRWSILEAELDKSEGVNP